MRLPVSGQRITRISFDHAVTFLTDAGGELRVETRFEVADGHATVAVEPQQVTACAPAVLRLLHAVIESAAARDDGALVLRTTDGLSLHVPADEHYEAWEFAGAGGVRVVCQPGGGLASWRAR